MTDLQQPKERCGFWNACKFIQVCTNLKCPVDNGNMKSCRYDTRSHNSATELPDSKGEALHKYQIDPKPRECDGCISNSCAEVCMNWMENHDAATKQATREEVLERIETYLCSCVWSDAPDCPGATNGEVICDGCERFEYPYPEDAREYVKSLRSGEK